MNRYLMTPAGARVGGRLGAVIRNFSPVLAIPFGGMLLFAALLAAGASGGVLAALGIALGISFLASIAWLWIALFRVAKRLDQASDAWLAADIGSSVAACHAALPFAFRGDFRTKAFHQLGLCAESRGDFAEAAELFALAEDAIPAASAPSRKRAVVALTAAHLAIALAAIGRMIEARVALERASSAYLGSTQKGALDALLDDSAWGVGALSLNGTLRSVERARPPRALLAVAAARVSYGLGAPPATVLAILDQERAYLNAALLPHERALADRIEALARNALQPGYRGAAMVPPAQGWAAEWAERALGAGAF